MRLPRLPRSWNDALAGELAAPYFSELSAFVDEERRLATVFPPEDLVFSALLETPLEEVRLVLLGQDPYIAPGQAHGLCLSVPPGIAHPPSLANLLRERETDLGLPFPDNGDLTPWARRGVLLLNSVLTVREGESASHQGHGWETFTDAILRVISAREQPAVFLLFGNEAKKKAKLLDAAKHRVLEGVHPSPLSAYRGFFGSKPFSRVQASLTELGLPPLDFSLPALGLPLERPRRSSLPPPPKSVRGR